MQTRQPVERTAAARKMQCERREQRNEQGALAPADADWRPCALRVSRARREG
jgi:hypothetical protein